MSDSFVPEPRKVGVWAEGTHIEAKEYVIPKNLPESVDEIPTIPDLDDLQDMPENIMTKPPTSEQKNTETVNALSEVGVGVSSTVEGIEGVLQVLNTYIPKVEDDEPDSVWTVETLLMQLTDEFDESNKLNSKVSHKVLRK